MTTTTANAGKVMQHLEYYLDVIWPELKVHVTSVTDQWAGAAIGGPKARDVLAAAGERAAHLGHVSPPLQFRSPPGGECRAPPSRCRARAR